MSNVYKDFRKKYNRTQEQLAEELEISQSVISDWEKGNKEPSIDTLRKIYKIFDIEDIKKILNGNNEKQ